MHKLHTTVSSLIKSQQRRHQISLAAKNLKAGEMNKALAEQTAKEALCGFQCPGNCGKPILVSARVTVEYAGQVELTGCCDVGMPHALAIVNERLKMVN